MMGNLAFVPLGIILLVFMFILDKSFQNTFFISNIFSFTVLFLLFLINLKDKNIPSGIFFAFGFMVDWYFKLFLGISSLISIFVLYISAFVVNRGAGNRWSLFCAYIVVSYILFFIFNGYGLFLNTHYFAASVLNAVIISLVRIFRDS